MHFAKVEIFLRPLVPYVVALSLYTHGANSLGCHAQETVDSFYSGAAEVAQHLLEGLASHLGLPRQHFAPSFEPHTSYLRLNYYPVCPEPSILSVNRHTDAGALTVLLQENGTTALQVRYVGFTAFRSMGGLG